MVHFQDTSMTDAAVVCAIRFHVTALLAVPCTSVIFDGKIGMDRIRLPLGKIRVSPVLRHSAVLKLRIPHQRAIQDP